MNLQEFTALVGCTMLVIGTTAILAQRLTERARERKAKALRHAVFESLDDAFATGQFSTYLHGVPSEYLAEYVANYVFATYGERPSRMLPYVREWKQLRDVP